MIPEIWLGSQESFYQHVISHQRFLDDPAKYITQAREAIKLWDDEEDDEPRSISDYLANSMIEIQGSVGILSIDGALVSEESYWNVYSGDVAYPTIANAVNKLLSNDQIKSIVTVWSSPGGDASGISDLGSFIKDAGKIKPIHAWTGKAALSAAYWAAASCKSIRASDLGETGSIGVIATFTSLARMLKDEGIDVHIERAGKYKAPLHPAEPISKAGIEQMQGKIAILHDYFIQNIEKNRPKLKGTSREVWAEGKTYFAKEAIEIGLVDGPVISLGSLISKLNSANTAESTQTGGTMAKQIFLSEQARAQVALGVPLTDVEHEEVEVPDAESGANPAPSETASDVTAAASAPAATETTPPAATELASESALTAYLKEQASALETKLTTATAELAQMRQQVTQLSEVEAQLAPIAIEAINRLQIGLGQTPMVLTGLPASALAQQYASTKALFEARIPAGRKSAPASDETKEPISLAEARLQLIPGGK